MNARVWAPLLALILCAAVAPAAWAGPNEDFQTVYNDWQPDRAIIPCAHPRERLVNARNVAEANSPYGEFNAFIQATNSELGRWDSGGCRGISPVPGKNDPTADFYAVYRDWRPDGRITACRFSRPQLLNALSVAAGVTDFDAYAPGFREQVRREITRWGSGACAAFGPGGGLRITRVRPKGGPRKESVTITNVSRGTIALRQISLRDRIGHRIRFPRSTRLRRGRSLRVVSGCYRQRRRAVRRGSRLYACKRKQLWNARGDVVKLVGRRGVVVAQRGYGRFRRVPRF